MKPLPFCPKSLAMFFDCWFGQKGAILRNLVGHDQLDVGGNQILAVEEVDKSIIEDNFHNVDVGGDYIKPTRHAKFTVSGFKDLLHWLMYPSS